MNLWNDLRYSARAFRHAPGFAATAVFTLAFGIGATTATFSVADAMLWKPVPLLDTARLAAVIQRVPDNPEGWASISAADFEDIRRRNTCFEGLTYWTDGLANIVGAGGEAERVSQYLVRPDFFQVVGVAPVLGRSFEAGEDQPGRERVVILSDALWRRRFAADRGLIGKTIRLDDDDFLVAGVMPPSYEFPKTADLWTPMAQTPAERLDRDRNLFVGLGRLKPGRTWQQAAAELTAISAQLAREYPASNRNRSFFSMNIKDFMIGS